MADAREVDPTDITAAVPGLIGDVPDEDPTDFVIDVDVHDKEAFPDIEIVPDNTVAKLRIVGAVPQRSKSSNKPMMVVEIETPDHPAADIMRHYLPIPDPQGNKLEGIEPDTAASVRRKVINLRLFQDAFGIPDRLPAKQWVGKEGYGNVIVEEFEGGGKRNSISEFFSAQQLRAIRSQVKGGSLV